MPVKPRKLVSAQGGRDSISLHESRFTTHKVDLLSRSLFSTAGSSGLLLSLMRALCVCVCVFAVCLLVVAIFGKCRKSGQSPQTRPHGQIGEEK